MLAGGLTIAAPGVMPAAFAANANLFVSAENSQFDNYMSGPQVIEVVVIDSDINDTDQAKGEPDVTVNGKDLRMVQGVDGNWYGYFADKTQAQIADSTTTTIGSGLDFGTFCDSTSGPATLGIVLTETSGFAVAMSNGNTTGGIGNGTQGSATGADITATCTQALLNTGGINGTSMNVIREQKSPVAEAGTVTRGQIDLDGGSGTWPFIQLYTLSAGGNVVIQYNKGGGVQSTTLTFDTVDQFASASLDRVKYTRTSQVHATITDLWLNIDPTDEDSWTFGTNSANATSVGPHYQVFNENGGAAGNAINIDSTLDSLMCEDNCRLLVNTNVQGATNPVLTLQDNDDSILTLLNATSNVNNATAFGIAGNSTALGTGSAPVTITEQGPNSGVFGTYDESDKSALLITSNAARGTSASLDYNETPVTILVGFDFATIDIQPTDDEWNSGEEIPVVLVDGDANKNSRIDEDLDLNDPTVSLIPTLETGDPFTLGEVTSSLQVISTNNTVATSATVGTVGTTAAFANVNNTSTATVQSFSQRAIIDHTTVNNATVTAIIIDLETTMEELQASINDNRVSAFTGFNLFNYDVRSLSPAAGSVDVFILNSTNPIINSTGNGFATGTGTIQIVDGGNAQALLSLDTATAALFDGGITNAASAQNIGLLFQFNTAITGVSVATDDPIVADFFSFGITNDGLESGERVANQIIRIEAEESGDNTSTFEGSLEYIMINQLNVNDINTYTGLSPIANDPSFIVIEDLTDEDSPRVNYLDLGADGVSTQIADQEEAPSHSGIVSFDMDSYKNADTVTITLEDLDLNVDSDLIDIYTVVTTPGDANFDVVGTSVASGLSIALSNGDQLGRLLDVTFDDQLWTTPTDATCLAALAAADIADTGLGATGFTLIETGPETGIFIGDFQIPGALKVVYKS
jgi:hypothetical protein